MKHKNTYIPLGGAACKIELIFCPVNAFLWSFKGPFFNIKSFIPWNLMLIALLKPKLNKYQVVVILAFFKFSVYKKSSR